MPRKKVMEVVSSGRKMTNRAINKFESGKWKYEKKGENVGYMTKELPMRKGEFGNTTLISNRAMRLTKAKRLK
jgi:hypothetical protein